MSALPIIAAPALAQTLANMPAEERAIGLTVAACQRLARVYGDLATSNAAWSARANEAAARLSRARQIESDFASTKRQIAGVVRGLTLQGRIGTDDASVRYFLGVQADGSSVSAGGERTGFEGLGELFSGSTLLIIAAALVLIIPSLGWVLSSYKNERARIQGELAQQAQDNAIAMQAWEELAAAQVAAGAPALPPLPEMPGYGRQDTSGGSIVDAIKEGAGAGFGALLPLLAIGGLVWILVNRRPSKGRR